MIRIPNIGVVKLSDQRAIDYLAQKEAEIESAKTYAHKRREEYGTIGDQLDEIFHNIDSWKERIAGIKAKYPKE